MSTAAHDSADILFHRELIILGKYPKGRLEVERLPDYKRTLFEDLYRRMNDRFSGQNADLRTRFGRELYFDFIDSKSANALAFSVAEYAMVGVTKGMLDHLVLFSGRLATDKRFSSTIGIPDIPASSSDQAIVTLLGMAMQFFTAHEIGHHVHGHVNFGAASGVPVLYEFVDASDTQNHIDLQAMELDADAYALSSQLPNIFGEQFEHIAKNVGLAKEALSNEALLNLLLAALICFLHTLPQRRYTAESIRALRHPPRLPRLNYLLGNIQRWCGLNIPELRAWPSLVQFGKLSQMVVDCSRVASDDMPWNEEGLFLTSQDGKTYIRDLDQALARVAEQMSPYAWK